MRSILSYNLLICLMVLLMPVGAMCAYSDEGNIVIADEIRLFTIHEKNGVVNSVKSECDTYYQAMVSDGAVDAVATYNDEITIDKATAPRAKPRYQSLETPDVFYDGVRICYMRVPVSKGKKVKVTFHQTYTSPEQFCEVIIPSMSYLTKHSKIIIKVPSSLVDKVKVMPYDFRANISLRSENLQDGGVAYIVETTDLPAWRRERNAPKASVAAPRVVITGQFADASALYRHFRKFLDEPDYNDPEITKLASELRVKAKTDIDLIDSTASWVRQNIRYLAVEHGEYAFRPSSPSEVVRSRAADCKGSANLIKALLRKNGLDGRLVWIGTAGEIAYDWNKVPALCSGNHVIAACILPDTIVYADGTAKWSSPGYIPPNLRGRCAMIEDGDDCIITNVENAYLLADGEQIKAKFVIDGNDLRGEMDILLAGISKMAFLSALSETDQLHRMGVVKSYVTYPKRNSEVGDVNVDADLSRQFVAINAYLVEINSAQNIGGSIYVDLKPLRDSSFTVIEEKNRTHDYVQPYSYASTYDFEIKIPENYEVRAMPENINIDNKWHSASVTYVEEDGAVRCRVDISTKSLVVSPEEISIRNQAVKDIRRLADSKLVLAPKSD